MNPRIEREIDEILRGRITQLPKDTPWRRLQRRLRQRWSELRQRRSYRPSLSFTSAGALILSAFALSVVLFFWRGDIIRLSPALYTMLVLLMGVMLFTGYFLNFSSGIRGYGQPRWRGQVIEYRRRTPIEEWWTRLRNRR